MNKTKSIPKHIGSNNKQKQLLTHQNMFIKTSNQNKVKNNKTKSNKSNHISKNS